jgi:hypothetical protein
MHRLKLKPGEKITGCFFEATIDPCLICGQIGYRILVIRSQSGEARRVPLCGRHYLEACRLYPEIRDLERRHSSRITHQIELDEQRLRCPKCGAKLEIGASLADASLLLITCKECSAAIAVENRVPRLVSMGK